MAYKQLTQEQRYQIQALLKANHNQTQIAMILECDKSTISREIRRNTGLRGYRPAQAQRLADKRRQSKYRPRISNDTWLTVKQLIGRDWSPEQVSLWLKKFYNICVSHEWIYQYILQDKANGGKLHQHLRCQKQRRQRYGSYSRRGQITDRVSIDERPDEVDLRSRIGDWELDTIIGKGHKQAIVSLTERKSRYALIQKVERKTSECVSNAIINLLSPFSESVITMTSDNGKEFADHKHIADKLDAQFYFAHPYASWEHDLISGGDIYFS